MNTIQKISAAINILCVMTAVVAAVAMPVFVSAQATTTTNTTAVSSGPEFGAPVNSTYTLLEPLPCVAGTGNNCTAGQTISSINIQTYIVYIFKLMVALAVLAAVIMCIVGGFEYMLSESVTKKSDAKKTIENALLGLAAALGSYLILYAINPNLVNVSLVSVPKLNVTTANISLTPSAINTFVDAAVAKDQTLTNTAQNDQAAADDLANQLDQECTDANGNLIDTPECQALYQQWQQAQAQAASSTAVAVMANTLDSFTAQTISASTTLTSPDQFAWSEAQVESAASTSLSMLPNDDLTDQNTIKNQENITIANIQNQAALTSYKNGPYSTQSSADSAQVSAINTIIANDTAAENNVTDLTAKQQIAANGKSQINAIYAAHPLIQPIMPIVP